MVPAIAAKWYGMCSGAVVVAVAATGCGASEDPPARVAPDVYQGRLERAGDRVSRELASVRSAGSRDDLAARLRRSGRSVEEAADALDVAAPQSAEAGHAGVVAGLRALAGRLSAAADDVRSGALCTPPAALAQLTRSPAAGELRSAARRLRARGFAADGLIVRRRRMPARQLPNGAVLARLGSGPGRLVVRNGSDGDGVVKLVAGRKRVTVYVARHRTAEVADIADGDYSVFFASGRGWDGGRNTFSRACGFTRFDETMPFRSGNGTYRRFTITLSPVVGGTAQTSRLDPREFPR